MLTDAGHPTRVHVMVGTGALTALMDQNGVAYTAPVQGAVVQYLENHCGIQGRRGAFLFSRWRVDWSLRKSVKKFQPDIVHAFLPGCIADGLPIVRRTNRRVVRVAGIRGVTPVPSNVIGSFGMRRSLEARMQESLGSCDAVVVNAPHLVETETRRLGVPDNRVHVIPNGVNIPCFQSDPSVEPVRAVVIANFGPYKGHDVLVRAIARAGVDIKIRMCGIGPMADRILDLAREEGIGDRFEIVPPPADIGEELASSQLAIHPSLTEGLSNAILEEMAAGLPIICTAVGGATLQVDDGVNGILVPADDVDALARAISALAVDPDLRAAMGLESRTRALQFSWAKCLESHVDLYSSLLRMQRTPSSQI
jgi:glycosyltransferase involved in cell wall biosynthesis